MTDHTRTEKIDGDSIYFCGHPSRVGNRYDILQSRKGKAIKEEESSKGYCQYHAEVRGHGIQEFNELWEVVQDLMNIKEIEFSSSEGSFINVITGTTYSGTPSSTGLKPITILHDNETARTELPKIPIPVLMIEVSEPFPYKSQKAIPWDNCNCTHQTAVNDFTGVGGLTRSGRCYAPGLAKKVILENRPVPTNEEQPSKRRRDSIERKRVKTSKTLKA